MSFDDASPLSQAYLDFLMIAKMLIEKETKPSHILGDEIPQIDLFFTSHCAFDNHNVSSWACSLMASLEELDSAFRLIWLLMSYRLMRVPRPVL